MAGEELVIVATEGVVAVVVTVELVIISTRDEEELVILPMGKEEELDISPMGEGEELLIIPVEVEEELISLPPGVQKKLVILPIGEEEELVIVSTREEEELVVSGVTISSSSASVVSPARLAAHSLSYWAIFSLILVPATQWVSSSS